MKFSTNAIYFTVREKRLAEIESGGTGPKVPVSTQTYTKDMPLIGRGYMKRTLLRGVSIL